jgi:hypothetical protein
MSKMEDPATKYINLIKSVWRHWRKPSRTTLDAIGSQNLRNMLIDGRRTPRNANYVGYEADREVKRKARTLDWKRLTQTLHSAVWRHVASLEGDRCALLRAAKDVMNVLASWGRPYDVNRSISSYGVTERWWYLDNGRLTLVVFENGRVTYIGQ